MATRFASGFFWHEMQGKWKPNENFSLWDTNFKLGRKNFLGLQPPKGVDFPVGRNYNP